MNEVEETLTRIEQNYRLFQQQQFSFIRALEHTRKEAHDILRPVSSIIQVQCYKDHHCYNATDRRILNMFLSICKDLRNLCHKMETVHPGDSVTNGLLEKCKVLLNDSNDLTAIRATYPHAVVNYLSLEEARHRYGGVVSLLPIVLDNLWEWVTYSKKNLLPDERKCQHCKYEDPRLKNKPPWIPPGRNFY
ncbi:sperm acrosome-associated protein 9 [Sylvia atricapilla]|uniref:sperm acrosome-associated protein 9 n=1 Tax=Sylvia atricapilla TaxID=48155 RepID=UPI0033966F21